MRLTTIITPIEFFIYAIFDPREPEVFRYVGATKHTIKARLSEHLCLAKRHPDSPFREWMNDLMLKGVRPGIKLLETCFGEKVIEAEKFYIGLFRDDPRFLNRKSSPKYSQPVNTEEFDAESMEKLLNSSRERVQKAILPEL